MNAPILETRNLSVYYNTTQILKDINLKLYPNSSYALIGPSGEGKSTLLKAIDGLLNNKAKISGDILFKGNEVNDFSSLRKNYITYLLQDPRNQFNPVYTIGKQIERALSYSLRNKDKQYIKTQALSYLKEAGLEESVFKKYPGELSGGMLQRANLAIALGQKKPIMMLDEPTQGLDPELEDALIDRLIKDQKNREATMLYITHSLKSASKAEWIIVLKDMSIVEIGESKKVLSNPKHSYTSSLLEASRYD